jgi:hypothetical protein
MCTYDETTKIVKESEDRILKIVKDDIDAFKQEILNTNKAFMEDVNKSHVAVSGTISGFGSDIKKATFKIEEFIEKFGNRISDIEIWKAVHVNQTITDQGELKEIKSILKNVAWLVIAGFITALLGLVLK